MRVAAAALFVVAGLFAAVALLDRAAAFDLAAPGPVGLGLGLLLLGLSVAALVLFNAEGSDPLGLQPPERRVARLDALGLLESTDFRAVRAAAVGDPEQEPFYLLELDDGRVLCLGGQYLFDYEFDDEPAADGPAAARPRRFPCTDFTVRRHRTGGHVVEVMCRGEVLEPERVAAPAGRRAWRSIVAPRDGQVLPGRPYDRLTETLRAGPAPAGRFQPSGREEREGRRSTEAAPSPRGQEPPP